jgi:hypothetical protein
MPRPRQSRALLVIPGFGGPQQTRRPGLQLASMGSSHRCRDVAPSKRVRNSCQYLGTSMIKKCHAHAWRSNSNAPNGLERVPKTPVGKLVIDTGHTSGNKVPHFSPSVGTVRKAPATGLWAPGERAPWPFRGHPQKSNECYHNSGKVRHYYVPVVTSL